MPVYGCFGCTGGVVFEEAGIAWARLPTRRRAAERELKMGDDPIIIIGPIYGF